MSKRFFRTGSFGVQLKGIAVAGARIYLVLAVLQFMLGMLLGGGLMLFGYDLAGALAVLRELN